MLQLEGWILQGCLLVRKIDEGGWILMSVFLVINVTLPDEKSNYVHRIGRVGRAERMGLAISLVSSVPEKVHCCQP